ncbi:hypothetical protein DSUL_50244 [Desulfovibrionales bacterium]
MLYPLFTCNKPKTNGKQNVQHLIDKQLLGPLQRISVNVSASNVYYSTTTIFNILLRVYDILANTLSIPQSLRHIQRKKNNGYSIIIILRVNQKYLSLSRQRISIVYDTTIDHSVPVDHFLLLDTITVPFQRSYWSANDISSLLEKFTHLLNQNRRPVPANYYLIQ